MHLTRGVQLSQSGSGLCQRTFFLHPDHLHPLLHDCPRLLVLVLAGLQGSASKGGPWGDHPAGHVHHHGLHTAKPPSSRLHQGSRRLVRRLCLLCLQCSPGICPGQLCFKVNFLCCNSQFSLASWACPTEWQMVSCLQSHFSRKSENANLFDITPGEESREG